MFGRHYVFPVSGAAQCPAAGGRAAVDRDRDLGARLGLRGLAELQHGLDLRHPRHLSHLLGPGQLPGADTQAEVCRVLQIN